VPLGSTTAKKKIGKKSLGAVTSATPLVGVRRSARGVV
jgi:hypothetical protein